MELYYKRRLLLLNQDLPFYESISPHIEPETTTTSNGNPLQVQPRSFFNSNIAYNFIIILTSLLLLAFIIFYFNRRHSSSSHPSHHDRVDPTVAAKSLPAFSYRGDEKKQQVDDCAICLEELREGEKVKMIVYCKHVFHSECIGAWLDKHVTCPICRCNKLCEVKVVDENGD